MKVLIGTDGSAGSREALEIIGPLLKGDHDEVVLYYAPPDIRLPFGAQTPDEIRDRARNALAEAVFDAALGVLPKDIAAKATTVTGTKPPRQGILLAADEARADLIVVGAHGASHLQQLLLGSTSTAVTHGAKVPVLIARRPPYRVAGSPLEVMVACDGSPASQQAGLLLKQFHWPPG